VFIEIDSGYGRSGVLPESDELIALGRALQDAPGVHLHGVLTHAGHSYKAADDAARTEFADDEAGAVVKAAERLREAGIPCPVVSAGSTPTSVAGRTVQGVNEERPGNYMFYDLMMAGRGVCAIEDIAVSVLTTVVAAKPERNHALVDAGILALSKDLGADDGPMPGVRYGLVRDLKNERDVGDAVVANLSQEQGWIASRSGGTLPMDKLRVGDKLRVLPNHSCITCAAYERYYVLDGGDEVVGEWPRVNGW
jgi:D-serine deaminase-like pyridoxal phosphate-dependent protein